MALRSAVAGVVPGFLLHGGSWNGATAGSRTAPG